MSVKVILSKKFTKTAQEVQPAEAPEAQDAQAQAAAAPEAPPAEAPKAEPKAPAAAPAQVNQAEDAKKRWIALGDIIKELTAYYNNQHNNGDKVATQVSEDDKNKKFTITITKSEMIKSPAAPAIASKKLMQVKTADKVLSAYPKDFLKAMGI